MTSKPLFARTLLLAGACLVAPLAMAAESPADAAARKALSELVPQAKIDKIEAAPIPGYRQVIIGNQLLYVSDDGKYLMQGTLFDTQEKRDLTAARIALQTRSVLDAVPPEKHIIFPAAGGKSKYKITVFTDIDCGYCRKMHTEMAEINKLGIEVDYLFFPRSGPGTPSFDKAVSVWCAKDRNAAFTAAKNGVEPAPAKCDNPIEEQFNLGLQVGVNGTPTVLTADGSKLGGYLPPAELLKRLQAAEKSGLAKN